MRFSIIIPVYNAEKYLDECVISVLAQNFKDYEIILIDDGSQDLSAKLCDEYAYKYEQISTVHKKNQGLSEARNDGIKYAKGEYIIFLDSDDYWCDTHLLDVLNTYLDHHSCDLIYFQIKKVDESGREIGLINRISNLKTFYISGTDLMTTLLEKCPAFEWYAVCYALKREMLISNEIYFPKGKLYEDALTTYKYYLYAKGAAVINDVAYCYRCRENSITNTSQYNNLKGHLDACKTLIEELQNMDLPKNISEKLGNNFSSSYYAVLIDCGKASHEDRKAILQDLKSNAHIMKYTKKGKQFVCRILVSVIGLRLTASLLSIRERVLQR